MRRRLLFALTTLLAGCAQPDEDKPSGEFIMLMESDEHHMERLREGDKIGSRLKSIRENIARAWELRPRGKEFEGIDIYFKDFTLTMTEVESLPWNKETYAQIDAACTRCHESYRK